MCGPQLVFVALDKVFPIELGVACFGGGGGQVVAQGVGVVFAEKVGHVDGGAAALAELPPAKVQVLLDTGCKRVVCLLCPTVPVLSDTIN